MRPCETSATGGRRWRPASGGWDGCANCYHVAAYQRRWASLSTQISIRTHGDGVTVVLFPRLT